MTATTATVAKMSVPEREVLAGGISHAFTVCGDIIIEQADDSPDPIAHVTSTYSIRNA